MVRLTQVHRRAILLALATMGGLGSSGCKRKAKPAENAALNLQLFAPAKAGIKKAELLLKPEKGATVTSAVELAEAKSVESQAPGQKAEPSSNPKTSSVVVRVPAGQYSLKLRAFDEAGAPMSGCSAVLPGPSEKLEASQGLVRSATLVIECQGAQSPLAVVNRAPENLQVKMPQSGADQQGSFAAGGKANFCLSAWDADHNGLRFEVKEKGKIGCTIQASAHNSPRNPQAPLSAERCYTVQCGKDFVGRVELEARVFDQVWRAGSKVDVRGCDGAGGQEDCQAASSKSLSFALNFVKRAS